MNLNKAIADYIKTKESLTSYPIYSSVSKLIELGINLDSIDLAGDIKTSERKNRIAKTRRMFQKVFDNMSDKSQNTRHFAINMLKGVLTYVENEQGSLFWKAYRVANEKKDIIVLEPDFIKAFLNDSHGIYNKLSPELKTIWETSCVMLVTALRFSDASVITGSNLTDGKVTIKNKKSGIITSSPLPSGLWDKLQNNLKKGHAYTEILTKDQYYSLFPVLFKMYPEMKITINGKPMYKAVKYHIFRKSSISLMLSQGIPESIVKKLSGHSQNSKSFERYVHFTETMYNDQVVDFQKKFYT